MEFEDTTSLCPKEDISQGNFHLGLFVLYLLRIFTTTGREVASGPGPPKFPEEAYVLHTPEDRPGRGPGPIRTLSASLSELQF